MVEDTEAKLKIDSFFRYLWQIWLFQKSNNVEWYLHNKVFANSVDDLRCIFVNKVLLMQGMFLVLADWSSTQGKIRALLSCLLVEDWGINICEDISCMFCEFAYKVSCMQLHKIWQNTE